MDKPALALVIGGAACVWDDVEKAQEFGPFDAVFAINDVLSHYPGAVDFAVSLHPEKFARWLGDREARGFPAPGTVIAHKINGREMRRERYAVDEVIEYRWPGMQTSGSSGLFAVKVAIEKGFDRIILAGVPMDPERRHFFDPARWEPANTFWPAWQTMLDRYGGRTRSMSGRTRALLGEPPESWRKSA